jgi:hypothetical protein
MRVLSWLAELRLASQEGSMELVNAYLCGKLTIPLETLINYRNYIFCHTVCNVYLPRKILNSSGFQTNVAPQRHPTEQFQFNSIQFLFIYVQT